MRILAAVAVATAFAIAPVPDGHVVTLRIDTVAPGQQAKVDVKSSVPGLHLGASSAAASNQLTITTPASVVVDANVDGIMIDAANGSAVRVSFEQGGSQRELALKIVGTKMVLRRNMDGDLVPGSRMGGPGRD